MTAFYPIRPSDNVRASDKRATANAEHLWVGGLTLFCLGLIFLTARDGVENLYSRWRYEDEYGYGFLIAALIPLLLWRRWNVISSVTPGARWPGLVIVIIAQLCIVFGALGESYFIEQIAMIFSLMGVGLIVFGVGATRPILPIAILLLLTVPLPYTLQAMLTIKLQLISTNLGVAMIDLFGIPVYADGNIIDLGTFKLQVAEACSGLRYLLPLTCLSFLIAYLYKAAFWKKAVVVLAAGPLTILLNSFRIAVTAFLVSRFGTQMAEGFLHEFEGWVVFLVGVLLLAGVIFALEGFRLSKVRIDSIMDRLPGTGKRFESLAFALPIIIAILVCGGTLAITTSIVLAYQTMPNPVRASFTNFPRQLDGWTGHPNQLDADTIDVLKASDIYNGDFVEAPGAPQVNLFIAYYDSLSKSAAIHSPRVCLPGAGWEFASFKERNFNELEPGAPGTFYDVVIQKGDQKTLMYYWYQQRERKTANEFAMKYFLLVDSFFKSRKDGALVRLLTPIKADSEDKDEVAAVARLHRFAHVMLTRLPKYLPQ